MKVNTLMLSIKKCDYSSNPWRIMLGEHEFYLLDHPLCFRLKRDAKVTLNQLLAIGNWNNCKSFTIKQQEEVIAAVQATDGYKFRKAILDRPAKAAPVEQVEKKPEIQWHTWPRNEWLQTVNVLAEMGVNLDDLVEQWNVPIRSDDVDRDMIFDDDHYEWICGVLMGNIEPSPIPF